MTMSDEQTTAGPTLEDRLDQLWRQAAPTLVDRIGSVDAALGALARGDLGQAGRERARGEAHRIVGLAGSFGLHRASRLARELEELLADPATDPERWGPARRDAAIIRCDLEVGPEDRDGGDPDADPPRPEPSAVGLVLVPDRDRGRDIATRALARGTRIAVATDAEQARELAARRRPDTALLDLEVAGAFDLLEQLGREGGVATGVFITDHATDERVAAARAGARAFLHRRATVDQAVEVLSDLLGRDPARSTILVVDDDPDLLAVAREVLESAGMRVVTLADPLRFWSVLEATAPDLVVLDIELPGVDGLELCRVLRQDQRHAQLPVLFLSGHRGPEMIQAVFESGGDDFVSKPIIVPELLARIRNRLERMQLHSRLADTDPLTGLANRRAFERRVTRLRALADRYGQPLAVALLDLDRFKAVNDQHGHTAGDAVLVGLADILEDAFQIGRAHV